MWSPSTALFALLTLIISVSVCIFLLIWLFGPGIDRRNTRRWLPHAASHQEFLLAHVRIGNEESGFFERPRPNGETIRLFYRIWLPKHLESAKDARAIVIMLHGVNSHSARNNKFMVEVLQHSFLVAGMDHEGMGRSDGRHGYFSSVDVLVDDAIAFVELIKNMYSHKKVFLLGASLGGLIILHALSKCGPKLVDGAVILCPPTEIHKASRPSYLMELIGRLLQEYAPKLPLVKANNGNNSSPEVAAIANADKLSDPLYYPGKMRVGTGLALLKGITSIQDKLHLIETPYLLQHGTADRVCNVTGSAALYVKTRSIDKTFKTYEGGHHDLASEPPRIRDAVVHDLVTWLVDHSKR
ncbi:phosphatidylinositol 3kinase tor2 [Plasmopara halstedii]|uniref:Phosphatidylinositol 3kinase tor2 n=1 Tax=Plasmopara halstedii TaxID=4781 RepID=A0A0P1B2E9_PLAHL|nr:phosphatidylinositol 3kinase tor2 [Plasmopara halstedii]CEG47985.1 phosphatidylinositol 3kinase tor2 [Plasmopara halstedii]|eukprot:XP_024584354.1 phosphatidylinositol 3kinase tor2 [Plasmopara halstedii]